MINLNKPHAETYSPEQIEADAKQREAEKLESKKGTRERLAAAFNKVTVEQASEAIAAAKEPSRLSSGFELETLDGFLEDFKPPAYLVSPILQRGYLSIVTALPGSGKTAMLMYLSAMVASGTEFCGHKTKMSKVIFMAGENPTDVQSRWLGLLAEYPLLKRENIRMVRGTFDIESNMEKLREAIAELGGVGLIVVDTLAAFNNMDDENDAKMQRFVHMLRGLLEAEGNPAVFVAAHPKKNATRENLEPRGSSAIMGELDCAYCLWMTDTNARISQLSHHPIKFRGQPFKPIDLRLAAVHAPRLVDEDGIPLTTVVAMEVSSDAREVQREFTLSARDRILECVELHENITASGIEVELDMPRSSISRHLIQLVNEKMLKVPREGTKGGKQYRIMAKGKDWITAKKADIGGENRGEKAWENDHE